MSIDSLPCHIYRSRSDEYDGETVTVRMLIFYQKMLIYNHFFYIRSLLSKEGKLNVSKVVYSVRGDPPHDLF